MNVQRIILLALIAGPASFLVFIAVQGGEPRPNAAQGLARWAAVTGGLAFVGSLILPTIMTAQHRRGISAPQVRQSIAANGGDPISWVLAGLHSRVIVRAALLEGAAFFNGMAYMTERQPYSIAVAAALLACIAASFPFRRSTEEWIERELRLLRDDAQFER
ncbi:hypothetical protein [Lacipirellula sp.]|uniref:hypothetical protein n=1 Tax=Lacipirellula sp. TaxID=2691419 RepID=UPI003D0B81F5